jgi:hypothetical protein
MEDKDGELKTIRVIESPNTTQFYLSISIPEVLLELKSRRTSLLEDNSTFSQNNNSSMTFACAKLFDLRMGIVKTEDFLTKVTYTFFGESQQLPPRHFTAFFITRRDE